MLATMPATEASKRTNNIVLTQKAVIEGTNTQVIEQANLTDILVEDGQVFFRLRFFRTLGEPERLYGVGRERSYAFQDLTLARSFRTPDRSTGRGGEAEGS